MYYASRSMRGLFCSAVHGIGIPADAVPLSAIRYAELMHGQSRGLVIDWGEDGFPILVDPPEQPTTVAELCERIDAAADATRRRCAGDPLRVIERDRAREQAEQFAASGYQGEVPRMVAAWAINGRTSRQAADSILAAATAHTEQMCRIREIRLQAKERVRQAMAEDNPVLAIRIADEAVRSLEDASLSAESN